MSNDSMGHVVCSVTKKSPEEKKKHVLSVRHPVFEEQKKREWICALSSYTVLYKCTIMLELSLYSISHQIKRN